MANAKKPQITRAGKALDKDLSIKSTLFNCLEEGMTPAQIKPLMRSTYQVELNMDGGNFKDMQLHYQSVCRYVRTRLIKIQQESHHD